MGVYLDKKARLFVVLGGIFIANALLAEVIGVKVFSLEGTLGVSEVQWRLFGQQLSGFNLTAGVLLWPVVFLGTDIINEYYGKQGVKWISILAAGLILYAFGAIYFATGLVPSGFWLALHAQDSLGQPFDIDFAFNTLFKQGLGIIVGSLVAFLVGQWLDAVVFQRLRQWTGGRYAGLRATGSTLVSQLIDSFLVLWIAFYVFVPEDLRWSWGQLLAVSVINYIYKGAVAMLLTPLVHVSHRGIERYLGKDLAYAMANSAAQQRTVA